MNWIKTIILIYSNVEQVHWMVVTMNPLLRDVFGNKNVLVVMPEVVVACAAIYDAMNIYTRMRMLYTRIGTTRVADALYTTCVANA
jgi:hypothetical protein